MKYSFLLALFLSFSGRSYCQTLQPGDYIPEIVVGNVLNGAQKDISLQDLKGKIVVLDFWATWCTPCIKGFDKLETLKKKFGKELEIIAVSDESTERISRFLKNRPVGFTMASDPEKNLQKWFPFISIPHVVVIDASGKIQAITSGGELNDALIAKVQQGEALNVSFKKEASLETESFPQVAEGQEFFGIKGFQEGLRSATNIFPGSVKYNNAHFSRFYLDAYGKLYSRLRYENIPAEEQKSSSENRYSLYLAIKEKSVAKVFETLKQKLAEEFAYKTRMQKEKDTVFILSRIGSPDTALVKSPIFGTKRNSINKGRYSTQNKPVGEAIAEYLEAYGIVDGIVIDETGDTKLYDIDFTWEPEQEDAIQNFLSRLGLKMERGIREYEVLVLYK